MKLKYIFLPILVILLNLKPLIAQTDGIQATNFYVKDLTGEKYSLYDDLLDKGKYVFVDFFWKSCGSCLLKAPIVDSAFLDLGCNNDKIFFIGIDRFSGDETVLKFKLDNNITMPLASGNEGGGSKVHHLFKINAVPSFILISPKPDYKIIIENYIPKTTKALKDTLSKLGIFEDVCGGNDIDFFALVSDNDSIGADVFQAKKYIEVSYTPNANDNYRAFFKLSGNAKAYIDGVEQKSGVTPIDPSERIITYKIVAENGDSQEWDVAFLSTSNVNEIYNPHLQLSPNPVNSNTALSLMSRRNTSVLLQVLSIDGKVLLSENHKLYSGENLVKLPQLADLSQGMYFLRVTGENILSTIRFVR